MAKVKQKRKLGFKGQMIMIFAVISAAVFLPTTALLFIGMLPTISAGLVGRTRRQTKMVTVGSMNLAGCMPFLLDLWSKGNSLDVSISIFSDSLAIVVMYSAAAVGYLIDWSVSGLVASLLYQKGLARQKAIKERQQELVARWGQEVTGDMSLDEHGFPLKTT